MPERSATILPTRTEKGPAAKIRAGVAAVRRRFKIPSPEQKGITDLEKYIETGLQAIKKGDYETAISIFSKPKAAQSAGLDIEESIGVLITGTPQDKAEAQGIISEVGLRTRFNRSEDGKDGIIKTGYVIIATPGMADYEGPVALTPAMRELIFHNVALINAEEWIHALRFKQGIDILTDNVDSHSDTDETEVALYLLQKGVPLTERFLRQYNRRDNLRKMGYNV